MAPAKEIIKKPGLSVIILTKNEAKKITKAIKSVDFADEIIVYDSGSKDSTIELAQSLGARVHIDSNWQGFGIQRYKAQKKAKYEWTLMLDADEIISQELKKNIQKAIAENCDHHIYQLPRINFCFGQFIYHSGWYPDWINRLYKTENNNWNKALINEKLVINQNDTLVKLKGDLIHYPYNNLYHYLIKSANYSDQWAEQKLGKKSNFLLIRAFLNSSFCFIRLYLFKRGFLDGKSGLIIATLSANWVFSKYLALWEKTHIEQNNSKQIEK